MSESTGAIGFQGERGANSDIASRRVFPSMAPVAFDTFEDVFNALDSGEIELAMIPIENTVAGRVADIHYLLPRSRAFIVGEHFLPIHFDLMGLAGARIEGIRSVRSHVHALGQCREFLRGRGLRAEAAHDTAGAARQVAEKGDPSLAALAPSLAAEIYGLEILQSRVEDSQANVTRFVILSREERRPEPDSGPVMTSFLFQVRNLPAALYKAMGGFATNGVNMTKLESYQLGGAFTATQFFADIEGHPDDLPVQRAFEELQFFSREFRILGVYPRDAER